jgi:hypothetical protein
MQFTVPHAEQMGCTRPDELDAHNEVLDYVAHCSTIVAIAAGLGLYCYLLAMPPPARLVKFSA